MRILMLLPLLTLLGCQTLVFQSDDSPGDRALKVGGRVTVGHLTLGISELFVYFAREGLVPEDETKTLLSELRQLEEERERAAQAARAATSDDERALWLAFQDRRSHDLARARHHLRRTWEILDHQPYPTPPVRHRTVR